MRLKSEMVRLTLTHEEIQFLLDAILALKTVWATDHRTPANFLVLKQLEARVKALRTRALPKGADK